MAIQRDRQTGDTSTPDRQIIRSDLTTFTEGASPPELSITGPARIGDVSIGRIVINDGVEGSHLQILDGLGLRWLDPTSIVEVGSFRNLFTLATDGSVNREAVWSMDDISDPNSDKYGTNVGRRTYISMDNNKVPGSESVLDARNKAQISLTADLGNTSSAAVLQLTRRVDTRDVLIQADTFTVLATLTVNGKTLPGGAISYGTTSGTVSIDGAGAYTAIIGNAADIPVLAGQSYRISFWNDGSIVSGGTVGVGDRWDGKFQRSTNGGSSWTDITSPKIIYRSAVAAAQRFTVPVFEAIYQPLTNANVRWQWLVAKTIGTGVTSQIEGDHFILVEHLGDTI